MIYYRYINKRRLESYICKFIYEPFIKIKCQLGYPRRQNNILQFHLYTLQSILLVFFFAQCLLIIYCQFVFSRCNFHLFCFFFDFFSLDMFLFNITSDNTQGVITDGTRLEKITRIQEITASRITLTDLQEVLITSGCSLPRWLIQKVRQVKL